MRLILFFLITSIFAGCAESRSQQATGATALPVLTVEAALREIDKDTGVVVVNFWSTWCKPCVDEMPVVTKVAKERNARFLLISLDTKSLHESGKLGAYVRKMGWPENFYYWLNETDADKYCPAFHTEWTGVIPATIVFNRQKNYKALYEEELDENKLRQIIEMAQ